MSPQADEPVARDDDMVQDRDLDEPSGSGGLGRELDGVDVAQSDVPV